MILPLCQQIGTIMYNLTINTRGEMPTLQRRFINQFDGSLESILNFPQIERVLNPSFTGHFLIDHVPPNGDVVTTASTTGETARWGEQTLEMEENAERLAEELKSLLSTFEIKQAGQLLSDDELKGLGGKFDRAKKYAMIHTSKGWVRIKGMRM